jgi:hypothetical protein
MKDSYGLLHFLMPETTVVTVSSATRHKIYGVYRKKTDSNPHEEVQVFKHTNRIIILFLSYCHKMRRGNNSFLLNITFYRVDKE